MAVNKKFKDSIFFLLLASPLLGFLIYAGKTTDPVHTQELLNEQAHGTAGRLEREYKVSVHDAALTSKQVESWAYEMKRLLRQKSSDDTYWAAPALTGTSYFVIDDIRTYLYRDIYFDTVDELCKKHNVSYRLRNRFKSLSDHNTHFSDTTLESAYPYRAEFQAKYDRKEDRDGFSSVIESRFEFREESEPFSKSSPPPPAPWPLDTYIPLFKSGVFAGLVTYPAQDIMRYFSDKTEKKQLDFNPVLVFVTERTRQHLHIETPWGYGPNPTQAYIISFDTVSVYNADQYLSLIGSGRSISELQPVGTIVELEVEFERNVSQNLDKEIQAAEKLGDTDQAERLQKVRAAFLADQKNIIKTLADFLRDTHRLELTPQNQSKFGQSQGV